MLRFFGLGSATGESDDFEPARKKYSRFAPENPVRSATVTDVSAPRRAAQPAVAPRPVLKQPHGQAQRIDEVAQLHAEAAVSVSVLRRALPHRFAEIDTPQPNAARA